MQRRLWRKLLLLERRPDAGALLIGVEDPQFGRLYRLRVGDYRVIYAVSREEKRVHLVSVGHRKSVYRDLGR